MTSRRQHTIPRFYLNPFLAPGFVYRRGEEAPRATYNPRDVAVSRSYYGKVDEFNTVVEEEGAPVFKQLIEDPRLITRDDWEVLSYLFANFAVRTPAVVESVRATMQILAAQANSMAKKMAERIQEALEAGSDLSEFPRPSFDDSPSTSIAESNEYAARMGMAGGHRLAMLFDAVPETAAGIQKMQLSVFEAPSGHECITSDRLLVLRSRVSDSPEGAGWLRPDAVGSIALCPSKFLLMSYEDLPGIRRVSATPKQVAALNIDTLRFADQEVYSRLENDEANDWMKGRGRWCKPR